MNLLHKHKFMSGEREDDNVKKVDGTLERDTLGYKSWLCKYSIVGTLFNLFAKIFSLAKGL